GPLPPLSLPHHHELHPDLPEEPQSGQGHRRDQEADGGAALSGRTPPRRARTPARQVGAGSFLSKFGRRRSSSRRNDQLRCATGASSASSTSRPTSALRRDR